MVDEQLISRGIDDKSILEAFSNVPRHLFIPEGSRDYAYQDHPLPIGWNQTISQPYIVALMTQFLGPKKDEKILEIGTGSGYQAAILAYLGCDVFSVERIPELAEKAKEVLALLNFDVKINISDGSLGWPAYAPFDKIIVTAAAKVIPKPLVEQLKIKGRLVIPVGMPLHQELTVVDKLSKDEISKTYAGGCVFVPLIGKYASPQTGE